MESEGRRKLKFESSWDDGRIQDLQLASLLKKFNLPAVFYLPSTVRDLDQTQIIELAKDFEIGGHTMTHPPDIKQLKDKDVWWEISENKSDLEGIIRNRITKFCYPRGRYNDRIVDAVKNAGYTHARTTAVFKTINLDPLRYGTTIHVFQRTEYMNVDWFIIAQAQAELAAQNGGTFHIWGHSWEIDRDMNWQRLEEFFEWLTERFELV